MATVYNIEKGDDEAATTLTYTARARFARHPGAPRGLEAIETWVAPYEHSETFGPTWPCRTRAALDYLLQDIFVMLEEYFLVLSRGLSAAKCARRDRREVPKDTPMSEVFPPDDGYITLRIQAKGPASFSGWLVETTYVCSDMVLALVGGVSP